MKNDTTNIALFYGTKEKDDAIDTLEGLQTELEAWSLKTERKRGNKLECNGVYYEFINIDESAKIFDKGSFFKKIYLANRFKNDFDFQCSTISEEVIYHPYPFQSLIDLVLEAKNKK